MRTEKMADILDPTGEPGAENPVTLQADGDNVSLPDGFDLTAAEFQLSGDDMVITAEDGSTVVVEDYFAQDNPPQLTGSDGAEFSGDMVSQLSSGVGQAAEAPGGNLADNPTVISGTDGEPIGNVENLTGQIWAVRPDGSRVELQVGDPVYQGDILES
ncbi:MAG: hypothetical protein VW405_20665, partial [Rhodospirillaceae bacterium]